MVSVDGTHDGPRRTATPLDQRRGTRHVAPYGTAGTKIHLPTLPVPVVPKKRIRPVPYGTEKVLVSCGVVPTVRLFRPLLWTGQRRASLPPRHAELPESRFAIGGPSRMSALLSPMVAVDGLQAPTSTVPTQNPLPSCPKADSPPSYAVVVRPLGIGQLASVVLVRGSGKPSRPTEIEVRRSPYNDTETKTHLRIATITRRQARPCHTPSS